MLGFADASDYYIRKNHKKRFEWYVHFIGKSIICTAKYLPDIFGLQEVRTLFPFF